MVKKKVCKNCKLFYVGESCPKCNSTQTAMSWQGRIEIIDAEKSQIADKIDIKKAGEYAIKVR